MPDHRSPRELALELALALREEIAPELGGHAGRAHAGAAQGGDVTFAIDARAEAYLERFRVERAAGFAFYSEDRGLVSPDEGAEWVLVVDPIDGTRPAMAGLEAACVSVAVAPLDGTPRMGDVQVGCVVEIKSGNVFVAERGRGVDPAPSLSANREVSRMFWSYGLRGRPVRVIAEVLGELIDASSVGGATFADAEGEPLEERGLLGSGPEFQISCVAAANRELHAAIVEELGDGIGRLRQKVG